MSYKYRVVLKELAEAKARIAALEGVVGEVRGLIEWAESTHMSHGIRNLFYRNVRTVLSTLEEV